eukprot:gene13642-16122_t
MGILLPVLLGGAVLVGLSAALYFYFSGTVVDGGEDSEGGQMEPLARCLQICVSGKGNAGEPLTPISMASNPTFFIVDAPANCADEPHPDDDGGQEAQAIAMIAEAGHTNVMAQTAAAQHGMGAGVDVTRRHRTVSNEGASLLALSERDGVFLWFCFGALSSSGIKCNLQPKFTQNGVLFGSHDFMLFVGFVIVSQKVDNSVSEQARNVRVDVDALFMTVPQNVWNAHNNIPQVAILGRQ